jgi:hypothetical protein
LGNAVTHQTEAARWAYEKHRCEEDYLYCASRFLRIKSKHKIGLPTLRLNRVQQFIHDKAEDQLRRTGWIRLVIGKARQVGTSTYWRSRAFHKVAFSDNYNSYVVNHDEPSSMELFGMDKTFYDALPPQLKPRLKYDQKQKMEFADRKSLSLVGHARNMNVGVSGMTHFLHLTEVARYPNAHEIQSSIFPTVSEARGEQDFSAVVIESTSRYGGEWFKEFAEQAMAGKSTFEFVFVPWFLHEDYSMPVPKDFKANSEERHLMKKYGLTEGNIVWWRMKQLEYSTNLPALFQDFCFDWEGSWVLPKDTSRTFKEDVLQRMEHGIKPGKLYHVDKDGHRELLGGDLEIWQLPEDGVTYDFGLDPSGGQTQDANPAAGIVIRRDTLEQVAQFHGRFDPASERFLDLVYWTGMFYNRAQITPDITGGWGHSVMRDLQQRSYPNIYQRPMPDDAKERMGPRLGFQYTSQTKKEIVTNAVKLLEREYPAIRSRALMSELRSFLTIGLDEWGAGPGCTDDAVNAYMLALYGATQERRPGVAELPTEQLAIEKPWCQHDVDADLYDTRASLGTHSLLVH